jgi:isoleucyl-tRNA synthetase
MSPHYEAETMRLFAELYQAGYIERGSKPVHWCIACRSALAEAEVEYQEKTSIAIDVSFRVVDEQELLKRLCFDETNPQHEPGQGNISIPIWTTTPWTLPANEAVALQKHADARYLLIQLDRHGNKERLLLARENLDHCLARYGIKTGEYRVLGYFLATELEYLKLQHPFYARQVPIILGEHVTVAEGTGAVHTAPAHGQEDYLIGQNYQLPMHNPVDERGYFKANVELFAGKSIKESEALIIAMCEQNQVLLAQQKIQHSYPHCWRHKIPLIFRATAQWFIKLDASGLRQQVEKAAGEVNWIPVWGKERMEKMLVQRPDWCISRQRAWGTPIPLILHRETGQPHANMSALFAPILARVATQGIEGWHQLDLNELLFDEAASYQKSTDTLDVWFDSGASFAAVLQAHKNLAVPADLYLEGSDQYRGWFQSSLILGVASSLKQAPYRQVVTHGFTVDETGRKMSKSLGNVIAPEEICEVQGADILRLWVAASDYRDEVAISKEILKRLGEMYRRIRNTARFLLANLHDFNPAQDLVAPEQLLSLDRWLLIYTAKLQQEITQCYEQYHFHVLVHQLHQFCVNELGGFYLDIIKDRQYTGAKNSLMRRSAQTVLFHLLQALVRWLAPVLSFTAEEIWQHLPGKTADSVFLGQWYVLPAMHFDSDPLVAIYQKIHPDLNQAALNYWELLRLLRDEVNKQIEMARNAGKIGSSLEASVKLTLEESSELLDCLQMIADEFRFVLISSEFVLKTVKQLVEANAGFVHKKIYRFHIDVSSTEQPKCIRCWHRVASVGQNAEHPDICARCLINIESSSGEQRRFA